MCGKRGKDGDKIKEMGEDGRDNLRGEWDGEG